MTCKWCGDEIRPICGDVGVYGCQGWPDVWLHEECVAPLESEWFYYECRYNLHYDEWLERQACAETVEHSLLA